jgi:hypothetical protein
MFSRAEVEVSTNCVQIETGYRITAVTVRKLEFEPDTFVFADKVTLDIVLLETSRTVVMH